VHPSTRIPATHELNDPAVIRHYDTSDRLVSNFPFPSHLLKLTVLHGRSPLVFLALTLTSGHLCRRHADIVQAGDDADSMVSTGGSRATLCVSSEVGCQMGCTFCATGTMGLKVCNLPKVAILQTQACLRIQHTRASAVVPSGSRHVPASVCPWDSNLFLQHPDQTSLERISSLHRDFRSCSCGAWRWGCLHSTRLSLQGDLTAGEIVEQLVHARTLAPIRNVVFMGMGVRCGTCEPPLESTDSQCPSCTMGQHSPPVFHVPGRNSTTGLLLLACRPNILFALVWRRHRAVAQSTQS